MIKKTTIGGQAILEGIVMKGPYKSATVVRRPDGELEIVEKNARPLSEKNMFFGLPIVRGAVNLFGAMKDGIEAINFSAQFIEDDTEPTKFEKWLATKFSSEKLEKILMGIATALGIILPVGLFILLPTLLAEVLGSVEMHSIIRNLIEGAIRIVIFLAYMYFVSKLPDIKRTFQYHGAEHKAIHCYESGKELTVENVKACPRQHPRCGTSFLFVVMIISILVFSVVTWTNPWVRMLLRIALLPIVVGISYEINRFVGRHDNALTRTLRAPGIWLQNLTTFEPDDSMMEVAIEALNRVIPENDNADKW